jgi:hypothetical protein
MDSQDCHALKLAMLYALCFGNGMVPKASMTLYKPLSTKKKNSGYRLGHT